VKRRGRCNEGRDGNCTNSAVSSRKLESEKNVKRAGEISKRRDRMKKKLRGRGWEYVSKVGKKQERGKGRGM